MAFDFFLRVNCIRNVKAILYGALFPIVLLFGLSFAGFVFVLSFVFDLWFLSATGDAVTMVFMFVLWTYALFKGETAEERMSKSSWTPIRRNHRLRANPARF
jgi:hypothetical protein